MMNQAVTDGREDDARNKKYLFAKRWTKSNMVRFSAYFRPSNVLRLFILDSIFAIVLGGCTIGFPFLTKFIIQQVELLNSNLSESFSLLFVGIGVLVTLFLVQLCANGIVTYWGHMMGAQMEVNMRRQIINKMHKLEMSYYDRTPIGSFISRMVSDLRDIPEFSHHAPEDLIIAVVTFAGGFTFAFLQSWIIGVVFTGIFAFGILVTYLARTKWRVVWEAVKENNSAMSASIGRQAEGISEIKSFAAEKHEASLFEQIHRKDLKISQRFYRVEAVTTMTSIFIATASSALALIVGGILTAQHKMNFASLIGLTTAASVINQPINRFVSVYTMLARGASSVNRFFEFMDLPEEPNNGTIVDMKIKGDIEFRNVSFNYVNKENKKINVLQNFNLKIKQGEKVALVGETGIGKSTILKLLLRFYEIQAGQILIDGVDIKTINLQTLRGQMGYIQQHPTIFDDTIAKNIAYAQDNASMAEIETAARISYVDEFVNKTTDGYQTVVGPRGAVLSGGQRQRLSIARAVVVNDPILLLDEATSALDNDTENKVKKAIETLAKNKTMLVVAHRLSTIKDVDRVVVLGKDGHILEEGTFAQLSRKANGHLQQLDNIQ